MNRPARTAVLAVALTILAGHASAERQPAPRFQLSILSGNWYSLDLGYTWEEAWPRLQAARKDPLLVLDERDVAAYDWRAQRIVLRPEVTRRLLAAVQTQPKLSERLTKLRTIWRTDDLHSGVYGHGFIVRFDGKPLYGGVLIEKHSQLAIRFPVLHAAMDEDRRVVLRFSPILWSFGSLWGDDSTGDALDSEAHDEVLEVQEISPDALEHLTADEKDAIDRLKRRILDRRVAKLFQRLGVPAEAPRGRKTETAAAEAPRPPLPLSLTTWPDDWNGWEIYLDFAEPDAVAEIQLRGPGDKRWHDFLPEDVFRLKIHRRWLAPGRHRVEIKLLDWSGVESGPYLFWFDPEREYLLEAKWRLGIYANHWVTFQNVRGRKGETCLDFSTLLLHTGGLSEVRYSLDGCDLDRRFPFAPTTDWADPPKLDAEATHAACQVVAPEVSSACVQLVYRDGDTTEPVVFHRSLPAAASWRPDWFPDHSADRPAELPCGAGATATLRTYRSAGGWAAYLDGLDLGDLREIRYRIAPDTTWRSTPLIPNVNPETGLRTPSHGIAVQGPLVTSGRHRVEILLVDLAGGETRQDLWFDPEREVIIQAKRELSDPERDFASLVGNAEVSVLDFRDLIENRDALREIRYSLDSCALDLRIPFEPWNDLVNPPTIEGDPYIRFTQPVGYACFQLVFRDGETTARRQFPRQRHPSDHGD